MESIEKTGIRPVVVEEIRALAEKYGIEQVLLFGSRARGDFYRASDIDLAVRGGKIKEFSLDVRDTTSTLLDFDIVDMEKISPGKFLDVINREGIVLYEKI
nr:nucleotidyltransferase domain-containing protein [uncultured Merdimonas sp.]